MDQGFPSQHTTATSVTVGTTAVNPTIRYDISYIKTMPGILKAVQVVLNAIGFLLVISTPFDNNSSGVWYNTVASIGFWISGILLSFYLFHVIEKFHKIPWIKIELIYCTILAVCYFIAASLMASLGTYSSTLSAAAAFGFGATIAYGVDAWLKYLAYKRGDIAQGECQPNKTVSSTTSPAY